jgi:hypothetical protein
MTAPKNPDTDRSRHARPSPFAALAFPMPSAIEFDPAPRLRASFWGRRALRFAEHGKGAFSAANPMFMRVGNFRR